MSIAVDGSPQIITLKFAQSSQAFPIQVLGKLTKQDGDVHRTPGLAYPVGQEVVDLNAVVGDSSRSIHLIPTPDASRYPHLSSSYGDHALVVMPTRDLWWHGNGDVRSWHANAVWPLCCLKCDGVTVAALADQDYVSTLSFGDLRTYAGGEPSIDDDVCKTNFPFRILDAICEQTDLANIVVRQRAPGRRPSQRALVAGMRAALIASPDFVREDSRIAIRHVPKRRPLQLAAGRTAQCFEM